MQSKDEVSSFLITKCKFTRSFQMNQCSDQKQFYSFKLLLHLDYWYCVCV